MNKTVERACEVLLFCRFPSLFEPKAIRILTCFQRKRVEADWRMIDSIILVTTQLYNVETLTKDNHFKDLPNVEIL